MNMKVLAVVKPPQYIYHGWSTWKTLWEDNFEPVNMTSCVRRNVMKHVYINNGEQYIISDISSKLDFIEKREVNSSESKYYIGIPGKGMTTFLALRTKIPNKRQKARFAITDSTKQDFSNFVKKFDNSCYPGYKIIQVHNEPAEAYFFLFKRFLK